MSNTSAQVTDLYSYAEFHSAGSLWQSYADPCTIATTAPHHHKL